MVRPKFCNVSAWEVCAMASSSLSDFEKIRCSKRSISSDFLRARLSNVSINDIKIVSYAQLDWQIWRVQQGGVRYSRRRHSKCSCERFRTRNSRQCGPSQNY